MTPRTRRSKPAEEPADDEQQSTDARADIEEPADDEQPAGPMARIRLLVGVGGVDFAWAPGEEVEMPETEAVKWADGERAELVTSSQPRETAAERSRAAGGDTQAQPETRG